MTVGYDLVVLGDANPDVIVRGAPEVLTFGQAEREVAGAHLTLGGSGALMAHAAARLGLRTAFVGLVGADRAGDLVLGMLSDGGVDVSGVTRDPDADTAMTVIFVRPDGDRAMLTFPGALSMFGLEHVDARVLERSRHVHAASVFLQPRLTAALASLLGGAREAGAVTSVDTNDDPSGRWAFDREVLLPVVDYLLPNEREAVALAFGPSGHDDALAAARSLAKFGPCVVVKCGAAGAFAVDAGPSLQRAALDAPAGRARRRDSRHRRRWRLIRRRLRRWTVARARPAERVAARGRVPARCRYAASAVPTASQIVSKSRVLPNTCASSGE